MALSGGSEEHLVFLRVMGHRLSETRALAQRWSREDATRVLQELARSNDPPVVADVLRGIVGSGAAGAGMVAFPRWPASEDVSWVAPLGDVVALLFQCRFEEYVSRQTVGARVAARRSQPWLCDSLVTVWVPLDAHVTAT